MKKIILILITLTVISFSVSAQSTGDYRSVSSGNWNDATKWEIFNGSNWVSTASYPGQNAGTGKVTIMTETEIKITASVPHSIDSLLIEILWALREPDYIIIDYYYGILTFSAESAVSLHVSGDIVISGKLRIDNLVGAKTHMLFAGRNFKVGKAVWDNYCACYDPYNPENLQTTNQDDKLGIIFNTTDPNSKISSPFGISFQDITFNGMGINLHTPVYINGTATFINGIVTVYVLEGGAGDADGTYLPDDGSIAFQDGATVTGASMVSFVDGEARKIGDDPFMFPIGDQGVYSPLTISAPVGQQELFKARYVRSGGANLGAISDPGLYNVSNCEYWTLGNANSNTINYPLDVTVSWGSASSCGSSPDYITNVSEVTLAHFNGSSWDNHGGTGVGSITNGSVTWSGVTTFSPFSLGNLGTSCGTPFGLTSTNITTNSATVSWSGVAGSVNYDVDYKTNYSSTWINAATAIASTSVNLSGLSASVIYYWRVRANCNLQSSSYRQAEFSTLADCGTPTGLSTTNITSSSATLSWSAVTNAINYNVEYKQSSAAIWNPTVTGTTSLSYNLNGLLASTAYNWRVIANCSAVAGNYAQSTFTTAALPPTLCNDVYEVNNTSSQAKAINIGNTISAGISSSTDIDWFKVTTPNNNNTSLEVTLSNLPADYDLYVYNKSLKLVGSAVTSGTSNEVVIYISNARKATYFIKVVGKNGAYYTSQCYNLLVQVSSTARSESGKSFPVNEATGISDKQLLYPNPASEFVMLHFNSTAEGPANAQILNTAGQLVKLYSVNLTKGYNQVRIMVKDIRPGMYILRINQGELNVIRKFVIAR